MARTETLEVPQQIAGTDLRPVVALLPVAATDRHGGAQPRRKGRKGGQGGNDDEGGKDKGGKGAVVVKGALASLVVTHLVTAGVVLKEALSVPDHVWDTAGIPRTPTLAKIALLPVAGAAAYHNDVKPKLDVAAEALELQGG
jgi:hypothetical protein